MIMVNNEQLTYLVIKYGIVYRRIGTGNYLFISEHHIPEKFFDECGIFKSRYKYLDVDTRQDINFFNALSNWDAFGNE